MTTLTAFVVLVVIGVIVVAVFARLTYPGDRRIDATSIDWRRMAEHRARFEASERQRISSTAELRSRWP